MQTLTVSQLEYGYGTPFFTPLSLEIVTGEITAVLGANGRGKTTLLYTLLGLHPAIAGTVTRHDVVGFVPQVFISHFDYSVFDIVLMGLAASIGVLQMPSAHDKKMALQALKRLGIADLAKRSYNTLSGGQKQLAIIARALTMGGRTLLLDEPLAALDLHNQAAVLGLLKTIAQQDQMSIVFTTHDPTHALTIADKTLLLLDNKKWLYGTTDTILTEQNLGLAYGIALRRVRVEQNNTSYHAFIPLFE